MIIGACGFGGTGSSIVADYLREYDFIQIAGDAEFDWVSLPDGLIDLEYHLNHSHARYVDSYKAIERYKKLCNSKTDLMQGFGIDVNDFNKSVNEFIDSITQAEWALSFDLEPCKSFLERVFRTILLYRLKFIPKWERKHQIQWEKYPYKKIKFSANPKDFDVLAKKHVMDVVSLMGVDLNRPIVFDQPFSGGNPQASFKYFEDPFAIVVDRDPRDLFIHGKVYLAGRFGFHIMPLNDVESYVAFYRGLRDNQPYKEKHERVLSLKLEDVIYRYDETTAKIREFLNLPDNPHPKSIYDPEISMGNTQLWLRYPQFEKEMRYIEQELEDYIYDFSGCPKPAPDSEMFGDIAPKPKAK